MPSPRWAAWVSAALLAFTGDVLEAQRRYIDGVFVASPSGPVELLAYAEPSGTGLLQLTNGAMDDVPTLHAGCRVLVSLPSFKAAGAIVATEAIFEDPRAERRDLRWSVRPLNIYASDLEFKDLRDARFVTRTLRHVKASDEKRALVFVIVSNSLTPASRGNIVRFYPIRLEPPAAESSHGNACAQTP